MQLNGPCRFWKWTRTSVPCSYTRIFFLRGAQCTNSKIIGFKSKVFVGLKLYIVQRHGFGDFPYPCWRCNSWWSSWGESQNWGQICEHGHGNETCSHLPGPVPPTRQSEPRPLRNMFQLVLCFLITCSKCNENSIFKSRIHELWKGCFHRPWVLGWQCLTRLLARDRRSSRHHGDQKGNSKIPMRSARMISGLWLHADTLPHFLQASFMYISIVYLSPVYSMFIWYFHCLLCPLFDVHTSLMFIVFHV